MILKSLTNKQLKDEILWAKVKVMTREIEKRYEDQSHEEQTKEYHELHAIYKIYWDEAVRRNLVEKE